MLRAFLFPLLIVAAIGPAAAQAWQTYVNERFGTTADVPAGWHAGEPPENGDGLRFTSPDGSASVAVFGSLQTFDTIDETIAIDEAPDEGETITYKHRGDRDLVVSGTSGRPHLLSPLDLVLRRDRLERRVDRVSGGRETRLRSRGDPYRA